MNKAIGGTDVRLRFTLTGATLYSLSFGAGN